MSVSAMLGAMVGASVGQEAGNYQMAVKATEKNMSLNRAGRIQDETRNQENKAEEEKIRP